MVRRLAAAALVVICGSASARAGSRHHRKLRSRLLADACPADSLQHAMPPHVHYTGKFDIGMRDFVVKDGKWPDNFIFHFYDDAALNASMRALDAVLELEGVTGALEAFDALRPLAFKADLWRYCLIWACGGTYLDSKMQLGLNYGTFLDKVKNEKVFRDAKDKWDAGGRPGPKPTLITCIDRWVSNLDQYKNISGVWQGLLIGTRGHPDLLKVIRRVVSNVARRIYPSDEGKLQMLYITGPGTFARETQWTDPTWQERIHLPCHWGNHGPELRTVWGSGSLLALMDAGNHEKLRGGPHLSYGEMYKRYEVYVDGNPTWPPTPQPTKRIT